MRSHLIGWKCAGGAALVAAAMLGGRATIRAATTETLLPSTIDYPGATATVARGINNSGQIVGNYSCAGACTNPVTGEISAAGGHGFLLENGGYTRIDVPAPGARATLPRGISAQGTIIGQYNIGAVTHGFTYSSADGTYVYPIDVPAEKFDHPSTPLRNTLPIRISPQGDMVGCFHEDSQVMTTMHGWLWRNGTWTVLATPHDPADTTSHDTDTMNNGVAATGQIAGFYSSEGVSYVADEGGIVNTFTFDGSLFTLAWDINARGDIVGVHGDNPSNTVGFPVHPRGFLRNVRGEFRDLAVEGATTTQIFGINDARDVVGIYTDAMAKSHGFASRLAERGNR